MASFKFFAAAFVFVSLLVVGGCEPDIQPETALDDGVSESDAKPAEDVNAGEDVVQEDVDFDPNPKPPVPSGPDEPTPADPVDPVPTCGRVEYEKNVLENCLLPGGVTGRSTWTMKCWSDSTYDPVSGNCVSNGQNEYCEPNPVRNSECKAAGQILGQ